MKIKNIFLFSIVLIILISNVVGLSFAHPGHGSEYPEEVSSSSSSHSYSQSSKTPKTTTQKSYSNQKSSTKQVTSTKSSISRTSTSSNQVSSTNKQSSNSNTNQQPSTENNSMPEEVSSNENDTYDVEEVQSSNITKNNNENPFNMTNILLIIGAFIIGFSVMILIYKVK